MRPIEQKAAADGTVEAWGRAADDPVGGWYGLRKGYRGRFGMYLPPLLEALGLAEVEHDPRDNGCAPRRVREPDQGHPARWGGPDADSAGSVVDPSG